MAATPAARPTAATSHGFFLSLRRVSGQLPSAPHYPVRLQLSGPGPLAAVPEWKHPRRYPAKPPPGCHPQTLFPWTGTEVTSEPEAALKQVCEGIGAFLILQHQVPEHDVMLRCPQAATEVPAGSDGGFEEMFGTGAPAMEPLDAAGHPSLIGQQGRALVGFLQRGQAFQQCFALRRPVDDDLSSQ